MTLCLFLAFHLFSLAKACARIELRESVTVADAEVCHRCCIIETFVQVIV